MYARVVSCFKVAVFRPILVVGVLVVAVGWAALFLGYLLLVGLGRLVPARLTERQAPGLQAASDVTSEETRTAA